MGKPQSNSQLICRKRREVLSGIVGENRGRSSANNEIRKNGSKKKKVIKTSKERKAARKDYRVTGREPKG